MQMMGSCGHLKVVFSSARGTTWQYNWVTGFRPIRMIAGLHAEVVEVFATMSVVHMATAVGKDTRTVQVQPELCHQSVTLVCQT